MVVEASLADILQEVSGWLFHKVYDVLEALSAAVKEVRDLGIDAVRRVVREDPGLGAPPAERAATTR